MLRVIIAGSRSFQDARLLFSTLDTLLSGHKDVQIVSGGARGADLIGEQYAHTRSFPVARFIPDWDGLGKSAGLRRNEAMALNADMLVAFWDGRSHGTHHMIETARARSLRIEVISF